MNPATWPDTQKLLTSQSYDALGQAADLRKNYTDAIKQFQAAISADPSNSIAQARLAKAYVDNKQYDEGIAQADKVLALPNLVPAIKNYAQTEKDRATKLKAAGTPNSKP